MKNGYNVKFVTLSDNHIEVYLEPQCGHESHRKKVGYIDGYTTFKITNNELMTIEVMESIVNAWKNMMHDLEES